MSTTLGVVDVIGDRVRSEGRDSAAELLGARIERSASSFRLSWKRPASRALYYRVGPGRLEWDGDLSAFLVGALSPEPDPGMMLALMQGHPRPPDASALPGVHRLCAGTEVRVDLSGVTVSKKRPDLPHRSPDLERAVGDALVAHDSDAAIAYSGGVASAFVAVSAVSAGLRPLLVHADLDLPLRRPPARIPGLTVRRVDVDVASLLEWDSISGEEVCPPLPDTAVPARLADHLSVEVGQHLVGGNLLEDLVSAKLPDADTGFKDWRLLTCEPFHVTGTLPGLARARELLGKRIAHAHPQGGEPLAAPPAARPGAAVLPWLTARGRSELETASGGVLAVWREHVEFLPPVLARLTAGMEERGGMAFRTPAVDPGVLAAASALSPDRSGRIRKGLFRNHLPLRRALTAAGVGGVLTAASGHWLRTAAAIHLHRARKGVVEELKRGFALADSGLVDPQAVVQVLGDGRAIAEHAMPLLRLLWLDRWLRGRG